MRIFAFGSSLTSCYWNGAATYYRGMYKQLHRLGHEITFAEPDIYKRQQHRDEGFIDYADVAIYQTPRDLSVMLARASEADLVIKHSGVGADDALLEAEVLKLRRAENRVAFWDVDAPATLARVEGDCHDPFRDLISAYDFVFTYGGGPPVVEHYRKLGARHCVPIYNALDPDTHFPVAPDAKFACDLAFVGNRLPDREKRVEEFLLSAAEKAPGMSFLLGGEGWGGKHFPGNVRWIGHVGIGDHNHINCSAGMVLNLNRESMAAVGFSPPTRVFEAAGAGACLITDAWAGVEQFFAVGTEILVARSAGEIVEHLWNVDRESGPKIGQAMRDRALRDHTYAQRAEQFDAALKTLWKEPSDSVLHSYV